MSAKETSAKSTLVEGIAVSAPMALAADEHDRLREHLERAVARICPRWLADQREDLVQMAMMRVIELSARSEKNRAFNSSYLWRVAYSALIDEIRRVRRRREVSLLADEPTGHLGDSLATAEPGPERRRASREVGRALRDCLEQLHEPRRLAVTLHLQGFKVAQAAPLLGWNAKRVYNLVHRGLADLRECLTAKGIEP